MSPIKVSILINRPVQDAWGFFIDLRNSPRWTRSGSELRQTSAGAPGLGMTIESVRPMFGREIKSQTMVVTQYEPGHLVSYAVAVPLLGHVTGGFVFENVGGATRLSRWSDLSQANRLLGPILARVLRRTQGSEMSNLKRLIEARPAGST
jgi:uncharacterized protein YndB with AHSA1/START domain